MPKTYSVSQAAKLLGYSTNTVYTKLKLGEIKSVRMGKGRYKISEVELKRILGYEEASSQKEVSQSVSAPRISIESQPSAIDQQLTEETGMYRWIRPVDNLVDWFLGVVTIVYSLSHFIFSSSLQSVSNATTSMILTGIQATLLVVGVGYMLVLILRFTSPLTILLSRCVMIGVYSVALVFSFGISDNFGIFWSVSTILITLFQTIFVVSPLLLIIGVTTVMGMVGNIIFYYTPQLFNSIFLFDVLTKSNEWITIGISIGILCFCFLSLWLYQRKHWGLFVIMSLLILFFVVSGFQHAYILHWRRALTYWVCGSFIWLSIFWETIFQGQWKRHWTTQCVLACLFVLPIMSVLSIKLYETIVVGIAKQSVQVKVENGKLYLDRVSMNTPSCFTIS